MLIILDKHIIRAIFNSVSKLPLLRLDAGRKMPSPVIYGNLATFFELMHEMQVGNNT
jgi:hypothetical protein